MKLNFDIWWHRIVFVTVIGVIISVGMFFIKEKPFSDEARQRYQQVDEEGHYDPPGTEEHGHDEEADEDHGHEPDTLEEHEH